LRTIRSSAVKEVRGRGSWIGIELHKQARLYCEALKEQGILCKETHDRSSASLLPWVITREEIDRALDRIRKVLI
jgi:ornithine--oxo-acid transaminase